jgi:hypothetical protein
VAELGDRHWDRQGDFHALLDLADRFYSQRSATRVGNGLLTVLGQSGVHMRLRGGGVSAADQGPR